MHDNPIQLPPHVGAYVTTQSYVGGNETTHTPPRIEARRVGDGFIAIAIATRDGYASLCFDIAQWDTIYGAVCEAHHRTQAMR